MDKKTEELFSKALKATKRKPVTYTVHTHFEDRKGNKSAFWTKTGLSKSAAQKLASEQRKEAGGKAKVVQETDGVYGARRSRDLNSVTEAEILEGMARGPYSDEWARKKEERGRSFSGVNIYDAAPRTPRTAKKWARQLRDKIAILNNGASLNSLYELAKSKGYSNDAETFGFHLGMQSIGHGVSWLDDADYKKTKQDDIKLPYTEFHI